jgi:hypothetical protein
MSASARALAQNEFEYRAVCPCGSSLLIRTPNIGEIPAPGWACLCSDCGGVGIFVQEGDSLQLRPATAEESASALAIPGLRHQAQIWEQGRGV